MTEQQLLLDEDKADIKDICLTTHPVVSKILHAGALTHHGKFA